MSDEKTYTEREVILRERKAFRLAGEAYSTRSSIYIKEQAEILYQLPTVTRPRVVADPHEQFEWSVTGGKIKARHRSADRCWFVPAQCGHEGGGGFIPTAERVALWADLLANPTETVEAES